LYKHLQYLYLARNLLVMEIDEGDGAPKLSAEADRELTRLWRTWRTVLEMLVDRVRLTVHYHCTHTDKVLMSRATRSQKRK
jgi:hypothetical protein